MSAFEHDDRVAWPAGGWPPDVYAHVGWQEDGSHDGYVVMPDGTGYRILPAVDQDGTGETVSGFDTVDEAIHALIGEPR